MLENILQKLQSFCILYKKLPEIQGDKTMPQPLRQFHKTEHTSIKYAMGQIDIYGNVFHECYELYLLLQGDVEFISSHTRQNIHPGQLVIIPPGEYHQFLVLSDMQTYERCVIDVWPGLLEESVLKDTLRSRELLTLSADHRIRTHYQYLTDCLLAGREEDLAYILPAVVTDILFLIKNTSGSHVLSPGKLRTVSLQLMEFIDAHYTEPLSLEDLAAVCFLSVSSVSHIFKEDFGISIKKYILQKRMISAHQALAAGGSSKEISHALGFTDYSAFYRAYKQYYGCAPSETKR